MDITPLTKTVDVPDDFALSIDYDITSVTVRRLSPNKLEKVGWAFFDSINTGVMEKLNTLRDLNTAEKDNDDKISTMIESLAEADRARVLTEWLEKKERETPEQDDKDKVDPKDKKPGDRTDDEVVQGMSQEALIKFGVVRCVRKGQDIKCIAANFLEILEVKEMAWVAANVVRWTDKQYRNADVGNTSGASLPVA